ncbi:hypothetical protein GLYMA_18G196100v4 [Glycine max]|uniref:Uncharacterized protein n=1 Tax=Glycine max TaxID=3847 RepID=K7MTE6_SOYBN|nr:hypothetical protein GYH30_050513 [Glycine max]KRH00149.1 hypothetical protein GLYMA_18G196100v4 [Glycine max]
MYGSRRKWPSNWGGCSDGSYGVEIQTKGKLLGKIGRQFVFQMRKVGWGCGILKSSIALFLGNGVGTFSIMRGNCG